MKFDLATGRAVGAAVPEHFLAGTNWLDGIRKWAMAGVSVLPSLALGFTIDTYLMDGEYAPNFVELASHSRASKAWYPNWDFKSGSEVGRLVEYGAHERRYGDYGALDEGSATNHIRNPRAEGAEGSTAPTNWVTALAGASATYMRGVEKGWEYVDIALSGTASGTIAIWFDSLALVAAAQGETWTSSLGLRVVEGTLPGTSSQLLVNELDSGGISIVTNGATIEPDAEHCRFANSVMLSNASTAYVMNALYLNGTSGSVSCTLRVYLPQLEQASAPTSPILPIAGTPAAATRAADVVSGVTADRASRGWYDTQWDYTSGGGCGDLLEFLPGVPRVGPKGLLVEEATTNHIRNPRGEGGGAGVLPTNWIAGSGLTIEGVGQENGIDYVEFSITNQVSLTTLYFETYSQIAMLDGEDWTVAFDLRLVSGSMDNLDVNPSIRLADSGGGQIANLEYTGGHADDALASGKRVRIFHSWSISNPSASAGGPRVNLRSSGAGATATFRVYNPQVEQKAYPTSVVLPEAGSPAAATRAADDPRLSLGSWFAGGAYSEVVLEIRTGC
ncbi:hypothetical protein [Maricaulis sp. MIT060901]|uniref:phage head spike fiber domain-containing protein n=1 Tax=Maricaulis sp. MIT060901 TaxID=3096993 RepID=UPI00399A5B80